MTQTSRNIEIRNKLRCQKVPFCANDNISEHLTEEDLEALQKELEQNIKQMLEILCIDTENDHNTHDTHKRVAKMFFNEVFKGRYEKIPKITSFPNAKNLDQVYTVGPIQTRSYCSHHFLPIEGKTWIAIKPSNRVIGLSKFNRLAEWVMARPQIQEEATIQLADTIENLVKPKGLAVICKARHLCMCHRGVQDVGTEMVTSVMRGFFRRDGKARNELMQLLRGSGFDG
tara:strand:- start:7145 stop:7831 length:687 start_codon:yes stop_codon:yes gene_type:complete